MYFFSSGCCVYITKSLFFTGFGIQTKELLRQVMQERVRPILFFNKLDKAIVDMKMKPEEIYQMIHVSKIIISLGQNLK